jgi:putative endonuclease
MTFRRRAVGIRGEDLALAWYEANGYELVARNWRVRTGELDLVVRKGRVLVFCEVKARSSVDFGHPFEAVTREKRQRIRHLAATFLEHDAPFRPTSIRFDVAAVLGDGIEVLEGAF